MCPEIQADPGNRETDPHGCGEPSFEARGRREQIRGRSGSHGNSQEDNPVAREEVDGIKLTINGGLGVAPLCSPYASNQAVSVMFVTYRKECRGTLAFLEPMRTKPI
jgi:hypothetical protein